MNTPNTADWLTAIGTIVLAIGTILLAIIATFQDKVRSWVWHPKLDLLVNGRPPDCNKTPISGHRLPDGQRVVADGYYLRLKVINSGNQQAEFVEVFVNKLSKLQRDTTFKEINSFLPINLLWANFNEAVVFAPVINPGMHLYCNLAHIIDPQRRPEFAIPVAEDKHGEDVLPEKAILSFDTAVRAYTQSYLVPPGTYKLDLKIAAANMKPIERSLEVTLTGNWTTNEEKMLGEEIGIRLLP